MGQRFDSAHFSGCNKALAVVLTHHLYFFCYFYFIVIELLFILIKSLNHLKVNSFCM